jgi:hypothetical protein
MIIIINIIKIIFKLHNYLETSESVLSSQTNLCSKQMQNDIFLKIMKYRNTHSYNLYFLLLYIIYTFIIWESIVAIVIGIDCALWLKILIGMVIVPD